jgi:hypothetical protein
MALLDTVNSRRINQHKPRHLQHPLFRYSKMVCRASLAVTGAIHFKRRGDAMAAPSPSA